MSQLPSQYTHPGAPHERIKELPGPQVGPGAPFASDFDHWVQTGRWEHVNSSNVAAIAYDQNRERLLVRFRNGSEYAYYPISIDIAAVLYRTGSKGTFIWDYLRVRGAGNTKTHQVNVQKIN